MVERVGCGKGQNNNYIKRAVKTAPEEQEDQSRGEETKKPQAKVRRRRRCRTTDAVLSQSRYGSVSAHGWWCPER
jgi:hypothetical protein